MRIMRRKILGFVMLAMLSACSSLLAPAPDKDRFVLQAPTCPSAATAENGATLLVRATTSSKLFDSQKIIFNDTAETRGFYQFAAWAESPVLQFTRLLLGRMECVGIFHSVSRGNEAARADYILSTEIIDFRHDYTEKPGKALVTVRAEFYAPASRTMLASRVFSREVPVTEFNAEGAVHAFSQASEQVLSDLAGWVAGVVAAKT